MSGEHAGGGGERWLLTYADMITLLMAFFIMMYAMSTVSIDKFAKAASGLREEFGAPGTRRSLGEGSGLLPHIGPGGVVGDAVALEDTLQSIRTELDEYIQENQLQDLIRTSSQERGLVITLVSDNLLFPVGEAEVRSPALAILDRIAGLLTALPNRIVIEGHTCSLPISTPRYPSNWELSAARACAVVRYLIDTWRIDPTRLAATGYAYSRPVAPNDTEDGRAVNRRVEIVILPTAARPEAREDLDDTAAPPEAREDLDDISEQPVADLSSPQSAAGERAP